MKKNLMHKERVLPFILPALLVTVFIHMIPLIWGVIISFQDLNITNFSNFLNAPFIGLKNYFVIFKEQTLFGKPYFDSIKNILFYVFITIPSIFLLSMAFARLLKKNFKGKSVFLILVLLPYITPDSVVYSVWRFMFGTRIGFVNNLLLYLGIITKPLLWFTDTWEIWPVIIASIWKGTAFTTLILLTGLENINKTIYEAAKIDGAKARQVFIHITLPLMKPVIYTLFLLNTIWHINAYNQFFVMLRGTSGGAGSSASVPSLIIGNTALRSFEYGIGSAMSTLMLVVVLVFTVIYINIQHRHGEY